MNNKIYLSKQPSSEGVFFLRIIKDSEQQNFEIDDQQQPKFSPKARQSKEGEPLDLLEVWIMPFNESYASVVIADDPVITTYKCQAEKVKIELINSQTNIIIDQTEFGYQEAFLESHIDDWSERLKPK